MAVSSASSVLSLPASRNFLPDGLKSAFYLNCHVSHPGISFTRSTKNAPESVATRATSSNSGITSDIGGEAVFDSYGNVKSVMSTPVVTTTPNSTLGDILDYFAEYTGVPVVDDRGHCVGMISNIDIAKRQRGRSGSVAETKVSEVMTSPAVALMENSPVAYAAGLMLKYKVHRLPVVNRENMVVGIITRRDIYQPLLPSTNATYHRVLGINKA